MNRTELAKALVDSDVNEELYALFGEPRWEAFHIEELGTQWRVSYCERGSRTSEWSFPTEDEACRFLLLRLLKEPMAKKSWPIHSPDDLKRYLDRRDNG